MLPRIPVYTSSARKRKAPSGTPRPPAQCNSPTRLSRARGAPMSAIGRSVGIKSCPWSLLLRAFRLLAARESILPPNTSRRPAVCSPKPRSPESIGEAHTPASARPITSLAPHSNAGRDGSHSLYVLHCSLPTTTTTSHVAKLLQRGQQREHKAPGPLRATCTTTAC